ncbi:MAG TPA: DUF72 domain-containing protein [Propionibacteriaceae bacterium]|nr:DUF72 domain-containing protein [Propionibacteriaceae bacterium]
MADGMSPQIRIGISGWRYARWRGTFYPPGLPQARELSYAAERMNSVEVNGSFYGLLRPTSYLRWAAEVPDDFVFAVKGSRFITHMKKLADVRVPLANFLASGPLALEAKLGPMLWQLPPSLPFDPERLEAFFRLLPRTTADAAALAAEHDERLSGEGRAWLTVEQDRPLRHALEVRHPSFAEVGERLAALLREHDIGLVVADTAGKWPFLEDVTSDFVYVRLHGDVELYASGYSPEALDMWAARARRWTDSGRDVYVYFDNDAKVRAPVDAIALAARTGGGSG